MCQDIDAENSDFLEKFAVEKYLAHLSASLERILNTSKLPQSTAGKGNLWERWWSNQKKFLSRWKV
jgi:hypothetical protein